VALLGDAAHAVVPFYGQGANAAFEDCRVLSACLDGSAPSFQTAFAVYAARRKPDCDALADLSIRNFLEMRSRVDQPVFKLRTRESLLLYRLFPQWFMPLYTMVSFTQIPYSEAVRRSTRQRRALRLAELGVLALLVLLILAAKLAPSRG
jgi:kynurenine 3-monooxygenase